MTCAEGSNDKRPTLGPNAGTMLRARSKGSSEFRVLYIRKRWLDAAM